MSKLVIAIDGPAGAGKSTVAKALAKKLGLQFLDTGAMYRCLALKCLRNGVTADEGERAAELCTGLDILFAEGEPQRVLMNGEDVTQLIRTPEIGEFASAVSVHSPVRQWMAAKQREIVERGGVTLEGRDTTTVTAIDAPVRIYLTASLAERARRRWSELLGKGIDKPLDEVEREIAHRDDRDQSRADSPLRIGEGVTVVNSDGMTADQVVEHILELASEVDSE